MRGRYCNQTSSLFTKRIIIIIIITIIIIIITNTPQADNKKRERQDRIGQQFTWKYTEENNQGK